MKIFVYSLGFSIPSWYLIPYSSIKIRHKPRFPYQVPSGKVTRRANTCTFKPPVFGT